MRNKRGFTLIELLAVIVILAIIALIAVPIILNMIQNARKAAAIDTAYGYVDAVEYSIGLSDLGAEKYKDINIKDKEYDIEDEDLVNIKIKGKKPDSGTITIEKRRVVYADLCIYEFEVEYKNKEAKIVKSNKCKGGSSGGNNEESGSVVPDQTPCELATETVDSKEVYYIDSEEDLYALATSVNSGNNYSGKVVELRNNLDFSNYTPEKKAKVCGEDNEGYVPIGTEAKPFKGTFIGNGKTIKNLTINKPNQNYVGIFGYASEATIRGLILDNVNVTGAHYVGSLIGFQYYGATEYIETKSVSVEAKNGRAGGIVGTTDYGLLRQTLMKNITVKGTDYIGYSTISNGSLGIIEHANMIIPNSSRIYSYGMNVSNAVKVNDNEITNGFAKVSIGDINYYESVGLNTWIAGDNDNYGYYYDYENSNSKNVVLKTTKNNPIPTNADTTFEKSGDYYLIKNETDWKNMSAFVDREYKFKLVNNLDFNNKQFYMMGSSNHPFKGEFDGGAYTIKNVTVNNPDQTNLGIFGKTASGNSTTKIYGLNLENINMKGYQYVGSLIGYSDSASNYSISVHNANVESTSSGSGYGRSSSIVGELYYAGLSYCLVDNADVTSPSGTYSGYIAINNGNNYVVEHANINSSYQYLGAIYAISNHVKVNGVEKTDGFDKSKVGDLNYYSSYIDTPASNDKNGDGYYFDYDSNKDGVYLVKISRGWKLLNPDAGKENHKWSFYKEDLTKIDNGWGRSITDLSGNRLQDYYFENGIAIKGWKQIEGSWYYFSETDADKNGYIDFNKVYGGDITIGNRTCTFNSSGVCTSCSSGSCGS